MGSNGVVWDLPSGYVKIAMENHHFDCENSLFQWPFSVAMFVYQRVSFKKSMSKELSKTIWSLFVNFSLFWRVCVKWYCYAGTITNHAPCDH